MADPQGFSFSRRETKNLCNSCTEQKKLNSVDEPTAFGTHGWVVNLCTCTGCKNSADKCWK